MILVLTPIIYLTLSMITGTMKIFIVLSESMVPVMLIGDAIIITRVAPEDIKIGDIIAFDLDKNGKTIVSHRVIDTKNNGKSEQSATIYFQTKGDNVQHKDPFIIDSKKVIGKVVFKIPYIGYLTKFSRKPVLFLIFTIIPSILIIVDELRTMTKSSVKIRRIERDEKKRKRKEERAIDRINYTRLMTIILIGIIVPFILNIPYVSPGFWINFSDSPYIMSGISYIIIHVIILLMTQFLWFQNRYSKGYIKEFKKEITRGLYSIRKMID